MNGTIGKVVDFLSTMDAVRRGVKIGLTDGPQKTQSFVHKKEPQNRADNNSVPEHILRSSLLWPLVKFNPSGAEVLCVPNIFEVTNAEGTMEARREQVWKRYLYLHIHANYVCKVPLILAWALSVHKSQGQTLERVRVDLDSLFERGQGITLVLLAYLNVETG